MSYIGAQPTTAAFPYDQFSGNGSTTAFTMSYAPASTTSIVVSVSGVVQNPNTYSVSGLTLTFSAAPPTGTNNIGVLFLGLPVTAVTSPGNTAYLSSTEFTATAGQTTFTPSGTYQVGFINVIRNGAQLAPSDYTATNGTTVTLNTACTVGDSVVVEVYNLVSVTNALPLTGGTVTGNLSVSGNLTLTGNASGVLKSGTAVASTSGTSIDFTSIPTGVKRITVMFNGVSTNSTNPIQVQIGSGSYTVTGYISTYGRFSSSSNSGSSTVGYYITSPNASDTISGNLILTNITSNTWVASFTGIASTTVCCVAGGSVSLSGALDRIRIIGSTTGSPTDTFDAGTVNIMWE
jgi:hypothetical protein